VQCAKNATSRGISNRNDAESSIKVFKEYHGKDWIDKDQLSLGWFFRMTSFYGMALSIRAGSVGQQLSHKPQQRV